MTQALSHMAREIAQAPDAVARLLDQEGATLAALGRRCRTMAPPFLATCARGSSDNAANFLKYTLEILTGTPVASIGPSVASVYNAPINMANSVLVTISQSGRSPDLVALQAAAKRSGALTVAFLNTLDSPVAAAADIVIPLHAGTETSVAATKSFISSLVAAAALAIAWSGNEALTKALHDLPATLQAALDCDWSAADAVLGKAQSLYTVGRGTALPVSMEAALKFKETSAIHAEAFSAAEIMHGPLRLVGENMPILAFVPDDAAAVSSRSALARLDKAGSDVLCASPLADMPGTHLPTPATGFGITDTIAQTVPFYLLAERISRARGQDPDKPHNLAKITETI